MKKTIALIMAFVLSATLFVTDIVGITMIVRADDSYEDAYDDSDDGYEDPDDGGGDDGPSEEDMRRQYEVIYMPSGKQQMQ